MTSKVPQNITVTYKTTTALLLKNRTLLIPEKKASSPLSTQTEINTILS